MVDKNFGRQGEINPKNSKIEKLNSAIEISITLTPVA